MKDAIQKAKTKSYWILLLGVSNLLYAIIVLFSQIPIKCFLPCNDSSCHMCGMILFFLPQFFLFAFLSFVAISLNRIISELMEQDLNEVKNSKKIYEIIESIKRRSKIGKLLGYYAPIILISMPLLIFFIK